MEPISTIVLSAACLAVAPATQRAFGRIDEHVHRQRYLSDQSTSITVDYDFAGLSAPATFGVIYTGKSSIAPSISPRELLKREAASYSEFAVGWNGPGSIEPSPIAMSAMLALIDRIPARLPLPRPMISHTGEVGIYWDLPGGYAEICFECDGTLTSFSRDTYGSEQFEENVLPVNASTEWFWLFIGPLDAPQRRAA